MTLTAPRPLERLELRIEDFSLARESTSNTLDDTPTPEASLQPGDTAEKKIP